MNYDYVDAGWMLQGTYEEAKIAIILMIHYRHIASSQTGCLGLLLDTH